MRKVNGKCISWVEAVQLFWFVGSIWIFSIQLPKA